MKRQIHTHIWLLLFLFAPLSVMAQRFEYIEREEQSLRNVDGTWIRQPSHRILFTMTPQAIDRTRIAQSLVWEFNERTSKNAAPSYMRAHYYLTERLNSQASSEYNRLLTQIWDQAETGKVDTDFLAEITIKPITDAMWFRTPDEDTTQDELLAHQRDQFLRGISQKNVDYARFSLREHPEQLEAVKQFVEANVTVFRNLEEGSRCDFCDFGVPFRETDNPIALLLPEIQNMRELARALNVKVMLEIHEKRYDDVLKSIRAGLAMARHTGKQPCLVCGLVGIAIQGMMLEQVQNMINSPDCPNLYWEVSSLPFPFLQYVDAAEIEKQILPQTFPLLRKAMTDPDAVLDDEWRLMLKQMNEVMDQLQQGNNDNSLLSKLPIKSYVLASYPAARQWLLDQGKSASEIDAMIPEKVVGLHMAYEIRLITGEYFKVMYLPLWERYDAQENVREYFGNPFGENIFSRRMINMLLPAMQAARCAYQRMQFSVDIMRIAEALRDYAARHDGQLPESLDAVTQVPVPMINPATGRAYEYKLIDGKGQIEAMQISPQSVVIFEMR